MPNEQNHLPTESDINRFDGLDERTAVDIFLGKTASQARQMFHENFVRFQEDLMWMNAPAFQFYVIPAIDYLLSEQANGDSNAANTFCGLLEWRSEHNPESLRPILPTLLQAIQNILTHFDRYDCNPDIYTDLPARYDTLRKRLPSL